MYVLHPIFALPVAGLFTFGTFVQAQEASCAESLEIVADSNIQVELRNLLLEGLLGRVESSPCAESLMQVTLGSGGYSVDLRHGTRRAQRHVVDLRSAAVWTESWLTPESLSTTHTVEERADSPPAAADPPTATDPPTMDIRGPGHVHRGPASMGATLPDKQTPPEQRGLPFYVALRAIMDVDDVGPLWGGGEVALTLVPSSRSWLGVGVVGVRSVNNEDVVRSAVRIHVRAGLREDIAQGTLRIGGGFGIASATARRTGGSPARDEDADMLLELLAVFERPFVRGWDLSTGLSARIHVPDWGSPSVDPTDMAEPNPLGVFGLSLQVGLSRRLGGTRG